MKSLAEFADEYGVFGGIGGLSCDNPDHALPAVQKAIEDEAWDQGIRSRPVVTAHDWGIAVDVGQEYSLTFPISEDDVEELYDRILDDGW